MHPLVSVIMSVHNEPHDFIDTAVASICRQSCGNMEFIIIDDASDDETYSHLEGLCKSYQIIKLYRNKTNLGLTATLNKGLSIARGEFIARMDADDYSRPARFTRQLDYLKKHPEIDILGTGVVSFGQDVLYMSPMDGYENAQVQSQLFFTSALCHPSVMIRKSFLDRTGLRYDESVKKGQDFDLWERASVEGKLAVLPDVLLYYRLHPKQITSTGRQEQNRSADAIIRRRLNRIGLVPTEREMLCHQALSGQKNNATIAEISVWINKLIAACSDAGNGNIDCGDFRQNLRERRTIAKLKRHKTLSLLELPVLAGLIRSRIKMKIRLAKYRGIIDNDLNR